MAAQQQQHLSLADSAAGNFSILPDNERINEATEFPVNDDRVQSDRYVVGLGRDGLPYVYDLQTNRCLTESVNLTITVSMATGTPGKTTSAPLHLVVAKAVRGGPRGEDSLVPGAAKIMRERREGDEAADKMIVDHLDGNRFNNKPENLRWRSRKANAINRAGAGAAIEGARAGQWEDAGRYGMRELPAHRTFPTKAAAEAAIHAAHVARVGEVNARPAATARRETLGDQLRVEEAIRLATNPHARMRDAAGRFLRNDIRGYRVADAVDARLRRR